MFAPTDDNPVDVASPDRLFRLREAFDRAGYTRKGVLEILDKTDLISGQLPRSEMPRLLHRSTGGAPLDTLFRVFLLGIRAASDAVERAIAPVTPAECVNLGLLQEADGTFTSPFQIMPAEERLFLQDSPWCQAPVRSRVMPISGSTLSLAHSMIPMAGDAALDVGTGSGLLALGAGQSHRQVLATDCNPRALGLATFNALFNRMPHVVFREGNLFEPAAGQTFDLVIANPPYVISPEKNALYRDSGLPADGVSAEIVKAVPQFLRPGGFAQVLINWGQAAGAKGPDRVCAWLEGSGCDAFLLTFETVAADKYASFSLPDDSLDLEAQARRYETWVAYFQHEGFDAIGSGLITIRRRSAPGPRWLACENFPKRTGICGSSILQYFAHRDFLDAHPGDEELLDVPYRLSAAIHADHKRQPGPAGWQKVSSQFQLTGGLTFTFTLPADALALLLLDRIVGERTMRAALTDVATALGKPLSALVPGAMPFVRCLIEQGFIEPVG